MKIWWKATRNARQKFVFQAVDYMGFYRKGGIMWFTVDPIQSTNIILDINNIV